MEAFREISHHVARFFGDPDTARRHKEVKFQQDMRALVEDMSRKNLHVLDPGGHFVPAPPPKRKRKDSNKPVEPRSAVADVMTLGMEIWHDGKLEHFIKNTTYDPALGYPIASASEPTGYVRLDAVFDNDTVFDQTENPIDFGNYQDLHTDELETGGTGMGGLGGGDEFSAGDEDIE